MPELLPLFLSLAGRDVVLVGGGRVAAGKLQQLLAVGARVRVVAPEFVPEIEGAGVLLARREFVTADLDGAWLAVAAATPAVNREVAAAAEARRIFVNAVDDPANASAYLSGVVRRAGVTIAISTSGHAPALTSLLRQALDAVLPRDLARWMVEAKRQRARWRRDRVPMEARTPRLLEALNKLYSGSRDVRDGSADAARDTADVAHDIADSAQGSPRAPAPLGHVSLVGAGPGDPALLTRKAIARLRAADLVLYDALIDDRILRYARKAQRFFVGKRAGRHAGAGPREEPGSPTRQPRWGGESESAPAARVGVGPHANEEASGAARASDSLEPAALGVGPQRRGESGAPRAITGMTQETIHNVMIRAARRGRRVVRLKGGDPFVLGRGGEERLALERAGVPFDIVPGVTSAIAAPALAGIPVTHRGVASAFLVVSGHEEQAFASAVGHLQPDSLTLVVLMGLGRSRALANILMSRGWSRQTPAAVIVDASRPTQQVWRGTLDELAAGAVEARRGAATLVIGDVVRVGMPAAAVGDLRKRHHG